MEYSGKNIVLIIALVVIAIALLPITVAAYGIYVTYKYLKYKIDGFDDDEKGHLY